MIKLDLAAWPPCEVCRTGITLTAPEYKATDLEFHPAHNPPIIVASGDDEVSMEVAYCPRCGRPLTEEAAEALRQRIEEAQEKPEAAQSTTSGDKGVCGAEGPGWPWCVDCIHQNTVYIGKRSSKEIEYDGRQCLLGYRWEEGAPYPDDF